MLDPSLASHILFESYVMYSVERGFHVPPWGQGYESHVISFEWELMGNGLPSLGDLFTPLRYVLSPHITFYHHVGASSRVLP